MYNVYDIMHNECKIFINHFRPISKISVIIRDIKNTKNSLQEYYSTVSVDDKKNNALYIVNIKFNHIYEIDTAVAFISFHVMKSIHYSMTP